MSSGNGFFSNEHRQLVNDVDKLVSTVSREAQAGASDIKHSVARIYDGARDRLSRVDESLRTSARHAVETTDDYAHVKPWRVVGVAALVGVAIGLLISRR